IAWTTPQDYSEVHECLRELHLPPYDRVRIVTAKSETIAQLRYWLIAAAAIVVAILGAVVYLTRLNLRLGQRVPGSGTFKGCVPQIVRQMQRAARGAAVVAMVLP